MSFRDEEAKAALIRLDIARASERARLAQRPADRWIENDRFKLQASAPDAPRPTPEKFQKRGPGRPPKIAH